MRVNLLDCLVLSEVISLKNVVDTLFLSPGRVVLEHDHDCGQLKLASPAEAEVVVVVILIHVHHLCRLDPFLELG